MVGRSVSRDEPLPAVVILLSAKLSIAALSGKHPSARWLGVFLRSNKNAQTAEHNEATAEA
jgi:hypothetical protein